MIKNFLNNLSIGILQRIPYVQKLESNIENLQAELQKALIGETTIASMHMENGTLNVAFRTKIQSVLAEWAFSVLGEFPDVANYIEIHFDNPDKPEFAGTIRVQRHTGKSPHELRLIAEAERDKAIAKLNELGNLGIKYEDIEVPRGKRNV